MLQDSSLHQTFPESQTKHNIELYVLKNNIYLITIISIIVKGFLLIPILLVRCYKSCQKDIDTESSDIDINDVMKNCSYKYHPTEFPPSPCGQLRSNTSPAYSIYPYICKFLKILIVKIFWTIVSLFSKNFICCTFFSDVCMFRWYLCEDSDFSSGIRKCLLKFIIFFYVLVACLANLFANICIFAIILNYLIPTCELELILTLWPHYWYRNYVFLRTYSTRAKTVINSIMDRTKIEENIKNYLTSERGSYKIIGKSVNDDIIIDVPWRLNTLKNSDELKAIFQGHQSGDDSLTVNMAFEITETGTGQPINFNMTFDKFDHELRNTRIKEEIESGLKKLLTNKKLYHDRSTSWKVFLPIPIYDYIFHVDPKTAFSDYKFNSSILILTVLLLILQNLQYGPNSYHGLKILVLNFIMFLLGRFLCDYVLPASDEDQIKSKVQDNLHSYGYGYRFQFESSLSPSNGGMRNPVPTSSTAIGL